MKYVPLLFVATMILAGCNKDGAKELANRLQFKAKGKLKHRREMEMKKLQLEKAKMKRKLALAKLKAQGGSMKERLIKADSFFIKPIKKLKARDPLALVKAAVKRRGGALALALAVIRTLRAEGSISGASSIDYRSTIRFPDRSRVDYFRNGKTVRTVIMVGQGKSCCTFSKRSSFTMASCSPS